jgi:hypothetical protein
MQRSNNARESREERGLIKKILWFFSFLCGIEGDFDGLRIIIEKDDLEMDLLKQVFFFYQIPFITSYYIVKRDRVFSIRWTWSGSLRLQVLCFKTKKEMVNVHKSSSFYHLKSWRSQEKRINFPPPKKEEEKEHK